MENLEFNPIEKTLDLVGNGGGGGAERLIVNVTYEAGTGYSADKTFAEIAAAVAADKIVVVRCNSLEYVYSNILTGTGGAASKHCFYQSSTDKINYLDILDDESVETSVIEVASTSNIIAKADRKQCNYVIDEASQLSTKAHGVGFSCICKGNGKIYTSDGTAWNNGVLGQYGVLYIAENEQYLYSDNEFFIMTSNDAATLGGYQPSHYATASDLAAKADKMQRVTTIPSDGGYNPNCLYVLTLDSTARTISLNAAAAGLAAEYHLFLTIGETAPTITWPAGLTWADGSAPTITAAHIYEINIAESKAYVKDWGATA